MTELALHIMDIMQNSIMADASCIELRIYENRKEDLLSIEMIDNGFGMDSTTVAAVTDPYFTTRTTRKVGMGLSLFKQAAEQCGGSFHLESEPGVGTRMVVTMQQSHIDRQPMGDMAGVISLVVAANQEIDIVYNHITESGGFTFDTRQIKRMLDDISITDPKIVKFIREMIQENLTEIDVLR